MVGNVVPSGNKCSEKLVRPSTRRFSKDFRPLSEDTNVIMYREYFIYEENYMVVRRYEIYLLYFSSPDDK